jgi:hypothetical protein
MSAAVTESGLVAISTPEAGTYSEEEALKFAKAVDAAAKKAGKGADERTDLDRGEQSITYASATPDGRVVISIPLGDDFTWHEAHKVASDVRAVVAQMETSKALEAARVADEAAALGLSPDAMGG